MYLDYFGLERDPFTISPDPAFLYPSPQHKQALAHLKYGLDRAGGFILLTGEVGTGKTTLTRLLLEQLAGNVRVAYILNAKLNSYDVLASICQELGLQVPDNHSSIKALTDQINNDLLSAHTEGKKTLVVIEEAQNLDPDVLETLRLLTNLETNTTKLLHILLVGQPELLDLISRNELRQLNQRVVSRFHIEPLSLDETNHYIAHRLRRAGCKRRLFDAASIKQLHRISGGIPRILNLVAERSLLGAYATGENLINATLVKNASKEVFGDTDISVANQSKNREQQAAVSDAKAKSTKNRAVWWYSILSIIIAVFLFVFVSNDEKWFWDKQPFPHEEIVNEEILLKGDTVDFEQDNSAQDRFTVKDDSGLVDETIAVNSSENDALSSSGIDDSVDQSVSPGKNAYERLLWLWGVEAVTTNQKELCEIAGESGLLCQFDEGLELNELYEINRPSLVTLQVSAESSIQYLLTSLSQEVAHLENSGGTLTLSIDLFERQWAQTATYLWQPPFVYNGLLVPMKKDAPAVEWIQQQLSRIYPDYEYIIGGGFYSQAIANVVAKFQAEQGLKPDGLVGPRTILRLMEQSEDLPGLTPFSDSPSEKLPELEAQN